MLTVLGGLAEFERELIRARTGEGRERAKARGVHMGRPPKLTTHQKQDALKALADGTASQADLARRFNVIARHDFEACAMNTACLGVRIARSLAVAALAQSGKAQATAQEKSPPSLTSFFNRLTMRGGLRPRFSKSVRGI